MFDTFEAHIAKERVRNSSRSVTKHSHATTQVGINGAMVYALLDVANAIRSHSINPAAERLLRISDSLVDAIVDGASPETIKGIAEAFQIERKGFDIDQRSGIQFLDAMKG